MTEQLNEQFHNQELLAKAYDNAREKSVVSGWWISIPIYIIVMLCMKTVFMPETNLISNIDELADKERYSSIFFFIVIPVVILLLNLVSIWKIYSFSERSTGSSFLKSVRHNIAIVIFSIIVIFLYLL